MSHEPDFDDYCTRAEETVMWAGGAKIVAEVDPAAYDDLEDLLDAMMAVERPEFKYG